MKKNYIILLLSLLFIYPIIHAQNVSLDVRVIEVQRTGYGDCGLCGNPDPAWVVTGYLGGVLQGTTTLTYEEMSGTNWAMGYTGCSGPSPCYLINNSSTSQTSFVIGLDAWENDCDPMNTYTTGCNLGLNSDFKRCTNTSLNTISFRTSAPCTWVEAWTSWCGDYRIKYAYKWEFKTAPTVTLNTATNYSYCWGTAATALSVSANSDANGNTFGKFFKWQISESTSCDGTGWVDIPGASSSSYSPNQIEGSRLYRCLVTSNCTADFSSYTTISTCTRVTYNPMGGLSSAPGGFPFGTGDNPPPVQSAICGSNVLPNSVNILNTLQPPNVDGVANLSGYTWAVSGGSVSPTTGSSTTWTAPATPGTYTITVTYQDACAGADASSVCTVTVTSPDCGYVYVAPAANGGNDANAGTVDAPKLTILAALGVANAVGSTRKHIKVAGGTYAETSILNLSTNVIIEGGYTKVGSVWTKNATGATTTINCSGSESVSGVCHKVGIKASSVNNWKLQDLTITTNNASGVDASSRGCSNYAVYVNTCTGYTILRCSITSGNASNGTNGSGLGANGSNGVVGNNGNNGSCDGGNGGTQAGPTGPGTGVRKGGNGGNGGQGGPEGANNGSAGTTGAAGGGGAAGDGSAGGAGGRGDCDGYDGGSASGSISTSDATNGANGATGAAGATGTFAIFYTPGAQAGTGGDGGGGGGGAGGGGGGGQGSTSCWSVCNSGGGNGGGAGGSGGQGGQGGAGGYGGGSTFGLYVNGTAGTYTQSTFNSSTAGSGGSGQSGGTGGIGANGGSGAGACTGEVGAGGNGSRGANGGAGGAGGTGAAGVSNKYYLVGTGSSDPSVTTPTSSNTLTATYNRGCTNSQIDYTTDRAAAPVYPGQAFNSTDGKFVMNLRPDLSSYGTNGVSTNNSTNIQNVGVFYSTTGVKNVTIGSGTYTHNSFVDIKITRTPPVITGINDTVCSGETINLGSTTNNPQQGVSYEWSIQKIPVTDASTPAPVNTFTVKDPGNISFTNTTANIDLYQVKYRTNDACCGWSVYVYDTIRVKPSVKPGNIAPDTQAICYNTAPDIFTSSTDASGGYGTGTYVWQKSTDNAGTWTDIASSNSSTYTSPALIQTTWFRRKFNSGNCPEIVYSDTIKVTVNGQININAGSDKLVCHNLTTTIGGTPSATGGTGPLTYLWSSSGTATTETITATTVGSQAYYLTVTDNGFTRVPATGFCTMIDTVVVETKPNPTISAVLDTCAYINGSGGAGVNYDYVLLSSTGGTPLFSSKYIFSSITSVGVAGGFVYNDSINPIIKVISTGGAHTFRVTDTFGCIDDTAINTLPNKPINIPYAGSSGTATANCISRGFNEWVHYRFTTDQSRVLVSINDNGNDIGNVDVTNYVDATTPLVNRIIPGTGIGCPVTTQAAMKRHFKITTDNAPSSAVSIRLYFTNTELNQLIDASISSGGMTGTGPGGHDPDGCADDDDVLSISDLYVTKYTGTNEDGDFNNNSSSGLYKVYGNTTLTPTDGSLVKSIGGFDPIYNTSLGYHYVELSVNEFSEFWLHGSEHSVPLPVEMNYLTADPIENKFIKVKWGTLTEINNDKFEVLRSTDATNFEKIGEVKGHGNSTVPLNYTYDDVNVLPGVVYYYKLNQVDFDGENEETPIVSAVLNATSDVIVGNFYPNPSFDISTLEIFTQNETNVSISIVDALGKNILDTNKFLAKGINKIQVKTNDFASGIYFATIIVNDKTIQKQIVVSK